MPDDGIGVFDLPFITFVVIAAIAVCLIVVTCLCGMFDALLLGRACCSVGALLIVVVVLSLWTEAAATGDGLKETVLGTFIGWFLLQVGYATSR
jgi:hypothetical protein